MTREASSPSNDQDLLSIPQDMKTPAKSKTKAPQSNPSLFYGSNASSGKKRLHRRPRIAHALILSPDGNQKSSSKKNKTEQKEIQEEMFRLAREQYNDPEQQKRASELIATLFNLTEIKEAQDKITAYQEEEKQLTEKCNLLDFSNQILAHITSPSATTIQAKSNHDAPDAIATQWFQREDQSLKELGIILGKFEEKTTSNLGLSSNQSELPHSSHQESKSEEKLHSDSSFLPPSISIVSINEEAITGVVALVDFYKKLKSEIKKQISKINKAKEKNFTLKDFLEFIKNFKLEQENKNIKDEEDEEDENEEKKETKIEFCVSKQLTRIKLNAANLEKERSNPKVNNESKKDKAGEIKALTKSPAYANQSKFENPFQQPITNPDSLFDEIFFLGMPYLLADMFGFLINKETSIISKTINQFFTKYLELRNMSQQKSIDFIKEQINLSTNVHRECLEELRTPLTQAHTKIEKSNSPLTPYYTKNGTLSPVSKTLRYPSIIAQESPTVALDVKENKQTLLTTAILSKNFTIAKEILRVVYSRKKSEKSTSSNNKTDINLFSNPKREAGQLILDSVKNIINAQDKQLRQLLVLFEIKKRLAPLLKYMDEIRRTAQGNRKNDSDNDYKNIFHNLKALTEGIAPLLASIDKEKSNHANIKATDLERKLEKIVDDLPNNLRAELSFSKMDSPPSTRKRILAEIIDHEIPSLNNEIKKILNNDNMSISEVKEKLKAFNCPESLLIPKIQSDSGFEHFYEKNLIGHINLAIREGSSINLLQYIQSNQNFNEEFNSVDQSSLEYILELEDNWNSHFNESYFRMNKIIQAFSPIINYIDYRLDRFWRRLGVNNELLQLKTLILELQKNLIEDSFKYKKIDVKFNEKISKFKKHTFFKSAAGSLRAGSRVTSLFTQCETDLKDVSGQNEAPVSFSS